MPPRRPTHHALRTTPDTSRFASYGSFLAAHWDSLLLFLSSLLLYTLTLSPDLLPADSGEFQVVVPLLGVPHPPGFSLYTLLAKIFISLIPGGAAAYRLNLFSAFTSSLTLVLVNLAVHRLTSSLQPPTSSLQSLVSRVPGLLAAFALGVSTTFWSQAVSANIRSLMALLTALLVYALIEYRLTPTINRLAFFAFALSLAVVHHLSIAFIGIVFAASLLQFSISPLLPFSKTKALKILLALLAPLASLLYLPLRGAANAFLAPPGLDTPAGFLQHALATGFGGDFFYFASPSALPDRLSILLNIFLFQFNSALLILFALGLVLFFRHDWRLAAALTLAFAVHCFIAITYRAPQTVEYLLPAYVILVVAAVAGLSNAQFTKLNSQPHFTFRVLRLAPQVLLLVGSLYVVFRNFPAYLALSLDRSTRDYAESALQSAPPNAVILSAWHYATPMWYLQQIEGLRPDVTVEYVFPQGASLAQNWVARINANAASRPTLITNFYPQEFAGLGYRFPPVGLLWQAMPDPLGASDFGFNPDDGYPHEGGWILRSGGSFVSTLTPGATFHALTHWQAPAAPTPVNFFVQLIGPDGLLYGQMDVSHTQIAPNEVLSDRYDLTANVDAPPGQYQLVAGAYLPDGTRLKPDWTKLADVAVIPRDTPPATAHPQPFGLLAGYDYDFSIAYAPRLYLHWRLDGQPHTVRAETQVGPGGDHIGSPLQNINLPASSGYITTAIDLPPDLNWQALTLTESQSSIFSLQSPASTDRYLSFGPIVLTRAEIGREADGSYRVDLDWLADRPVTDDLVVKVDLVGENYSWRAQSDSIPAGGAIPTLKWIPGIPIHDRHRLTVPVGAVFNREAEAAFQLAVYDHFTQRNLPILDSRLAALGPTAPLGVVQP